MNRRGFFAAMAGLCAAAIAPKAKAIGPDFQMERIREGGFVELYRDGNLVGFQTICSKGYQQVGKGGGPWLITTNNAQIRARRHP